MLDGMNDDPQEHRLSDAQLAEALALTRDADSVELKLTIPDAQRRATVAALEMDPLDAQIRQVFFFDTPTSPSTRTASSYEHVGARAVTTTPWSRRVPWSPRRSRPRYAGPGTWSSRSTPCPEVSSARPA